MYRIIHPDGSDTEIAKPSLDEIIAIVGKNVQTFKVQDQHSIKVYASTIPAGRPANGRAFNLLNVVVFGDVIWTNEE
jgi:hypothetical protein